MFLLLFSGKDLISLLGSHFVLIQHHQSLPLLRCCLELYEVLVMTSETYEARAFKRVVREEKKDLTNPIGRYRKTNLIPRVLSPASRKNLGCGWSRGSPNLGVSSEQVYRQRFTHHTDAFNTCVSLMGFEMILCGEDVYKSIFASSEISRLFGLSRI